MQRINFNQGWIFYKDQDEMKESVILPHDAMLYEKRNKDAESGAAGGYYEGGVYHYEKRFTVMGMAASGNAIYKDEGCRDESTQPVMNNSLIFNVITTFTGPGMNQMANSKKIDTLTTACMDALDIAGYNYASGRYSKEGKCHPNRLIYGSETFPGDIVKNWRCIQKYPYLIGDFMWTAWDYLGEAGSGAWSYEKDGLGRRNCIS